MTKFSKNNSGFVFSDSSGLEIPDIKVQDIELKKKEFKYDINKEMQDLLKGAQEKEGDSVDFVMSDFDIGDVSGIAVLSGIDELLIKAKDLLTKKQYQKALSVLEEALLIDNVHHEAIYLKAFCQDKLNQPFNALKTLSPIQNAVLNPQLKTRVESLRNNIRQIMMVEILLMSLMDPKGTKRYQIINQLEELIHIDHNFDIYYYLLGVNLVKSGKYDKALQVVTNGLDVVSHTTSRPLINLKKHIEREHLSNLLKPAIYAYKKRQYRKARSELNKIKYEYRGSSLFQIFNSYFNQLDRGGLFSFLSSSQKLPRPKGKIEDVTEMYSLIITEEVDKAFFFLFKGNIREAEKFFKLAQSYTPYYSFINYTTGGCIYRSVMTELTTSRAKPNFDVVKSDLLLAKTFVKNATDSRDKDIAKSLMNVINTSLDQVETIKSQINDTKITNSHIQPFNDLMQRLNSGSIRITSRHQFNEYKNTFYGIKRRAQTDRSKLKTIQAKNNIDNLIKAVDNVLNQFSSY